jgi:hypothetical protein
MTICFADLADWTPTGKLKLGCPSCSTLVLPGERALALAVFERSKLPRIRFLGATSRCECILVAVASIQRQGPYMRVPGPAYPGLPSGFQPASNISSLSRIRLPATNDVVLRLTFIGPFLSGV